MHSVGSSTLNTLIYTLLCLAPLKLYVLLLPRLSKLPSLCYSNEPGNLCNLNRYKEIQPDTLKFHSTRKPVTTMLTYPWKCTVLHCNHLGNTWKPLVLMTQYFDYCPSASEDDNQSVRSSAPVVSRCFPGGYNVKLYISRGRLAWWLLAFLHSVPRSIVVGVKCVGHWLYI